LSPADIEGHSALVGISTCVDLINVTIRCRCAVGLRHGASWALSRAYLQGEQNAHETQAVAGSMTTWSSKTRWQHETITLHIDRAMPQMFHSSRDWQCSLKKRFSAVPLFPEDPCTLVASMKWPWRSGQGWEEGKQPHHLWWHMTC